MKRIGLIGTLLCGVGVVHAAIVDDFEVYTPGSVPSGVWRDAADYVTDPSNPSPTALVIGTTDAMGNATQAVQIRDAIGTSGGLIARVGHSDVQRFQVDVRLDQQGNGSVPNWMSAVGFFQDTAQTDFNWSPQAVVYASGNGRFRLFVQNADGQGGASRDFGLQGGAWSMNTWYRVVLEADTVNGLFDVAITDLDSGSVIADVSRSYTGWNADFGRYDLVSMNDGEYGSNPGTIGNMSSYDNANYVPAPGVISLLGSGALLATRRRRAG